MNKEKLEQDIQVMKDKLASMESELNKPNIEPFWKPEDGKTYHTVTSYGTIVDTQTWTSERQLIGTAYKTEEEAKKELDLMLAKQRVKEAIWYLNGGKFLEFKKGKDNCSFDLYTNGLFAESWLQTKWYPNWQYLVSKEAVKELIKTHHEDLMLIRGE